jgi:hypothetical protein
MALPRFCCKFRNRIPVFSLNKIPRRHLEAKQFRRDQACCPLELDGAVAASDLNFSTPSIPLHLQACDVGDDRTHYRHDSPNKYAGKHTTLRTSYATTGGAVCMSPGRDFAFRPFFLPYSPGIRE